MLTIVIPTCNRSGYLQRLLKYYADLRCPFLLVIGDASDPPERRANEETVRRLPARLRIDYRIDSGGPGASPGVGTIAWMNRTLKALDTPYCVFVADDDFVVPKALEEAVAFLEAHPDYSIVHGEAAVFRALNNGPRARIVYGDYPQKSLSEELASERLFRHLSADTGMEFSVKRTSQAVLCWQSIQELRLDNRFGELLVSSLGVIQGKTMKLNRLYMLREAHSQMTSVRSKDLFDWVADPSWFGQYEGFRDRIAAALVEQEGLSLEEARGKVQGAFWASLSGLLPLKWRQRYAPDRIRRMLPSFSFLPFWQLSRAYPADFIPIDRTIRSFLAQLQEVPC